ncbi:5'-nucleotidase C-terminal domain-containing protein [Bacillus sp. CGMCC 1.16607]|uniref:5'-nucleotidase C-terminal domain-containing protein n=1 Tax=Bacillus sp. CGMCC 1.16607 TaxID=3351842 RepID=UPI00362D3D2F
MNFTKSYRKLLATATTATLVAAAMTPAAFAADSQFTDVPDSHKAAVDFLISKGATGKSATLFGINDSIKRADAAILLAKVLGLDTENTPDADFTDVPEQAKGAVNALKAAGITSGKTATTFGSDSTISRGELAIWITNGFKLIGQKEYTYTDVNSKYGTAIQSIVANNVIKGISQTKFGFNQSANSGEVAIFLYAAAQAIEKGKLDLTIMHTNDTHANAARFAKRATAVKEVRAQKPNNLLIDAGDVFSGTLYFNEFQGQADLELMNYLGYDMMTFGNHEFDLGASPDGHKALSEFVKKAKFPFISANVDFSKDALFNGLQNRGTVAEKIENGQIFDGIIKVVDGQKVGIFGLTTAETAGISSPVNVTFSDYVKESERMVQEFKKLGVNKIIAVSHLGYDDNVAFDNDLELAKKVEGIDVIIGGHTHTKLAEPTVISEGKQEPTIIVQAYEYGQALGTLDVTFDYYGKITGHAGKLIVTDDKATIEEDAGALEILKPYKEQVTKLQNQSIGAETTTKLDGERANARTRETNLGNLITDGMLATAKTINPDTVIALTNGGGIRASIDAGDITLGEILTVMPFINTLGIMNLKGSEIKTALEQSVSQVPKENGGFLHVSGLKFTYDSSKEAGKRVVSIEVKGKDGSFTALDESKNYIVATNTFTAKGGDNYDVFKKVYAEGRVSEPGNVDYEMFRDYLQTSKKIDVKVEGRIVDVKK